MKKLIENKRIALAVGIFVTFLWGSAFPVLKLTYKYLNIGQFDYYSKFYIAGLRFFIASMVVLLIILIKDKNLLKEIRPNFKFLFINALIATTFQYIFFYVGIGNTSGVKSAIFQASGSFLVVLFSPLFISEEKMTPRKSLALVLGFLGIIISNLNKGFDFHFVFQGDGFILITGLLTAVSTILIKKRGENISPLIISFSQMFMGSIILIVLGKFGMEEGLTFNGMSYFLLVYSAFISSIAFSLWYLLLQEYHASKISFLKLFVPIFGSSLSSLILKESFNKFMIIGLILVILGVYFINTKSKKSLEIEG